MEFPGRHPERGRKRCWSRFRSSQRFQEPGTSEYGHGSAAPRLHQDLESAL